MSVNVDPRHSIAHDQCPLRSGRRVTPEQARFVAINFGHYVGRFEGRTRLSSICWRFYQGNNCYHRRQASKSGYRGPQRRKKSRRRSNGLKATSSPNRFLSPPPPHL